MDCRQSRMEGMLNVTRRPRVGDLLIQRYGTLQGHQSHHSTPAPA